MNNQFKGPQQYDLEIVDEDSNMVGKIRVTPASIKWKAKGEHKYYSVPLTRFEAWITSPGSGSRKTKK